MDEDLNKQSHSEAKKNSIYVSRSPSIEQNRKITKEDIYKLKIQRNKLSDEVRRLRARVSYLQDKVQKGDILQNISESSTTLYSSPLSNPNKRRQYNNFRYYLQNKFEKQMDNGNKKSKDRDIHPPIFEKKNPKNRNIRSKINQNNTISNQKQSKNINLTKSEDNVSYNILNDYEDLDEDEINYILQSGLSGGASGSQSNLLKQLKKQYDTLKLIIEKQKTEIDKLFESDKANLINEMQEELIVLHNEELRLQSDKTKLQEEIIASYESYHDFFYEIGIGEYYPKITFSESPNNLNNSMIKSKKKSIISKDINKNKLKKKADEVICNFKVNFDDLYSYIIDGNCSISSIVKADDIVKACRFTIQSQKRKFEKRSAILHKYEIANKNLKSKLLRISQEEDEKKRNSESEVLEIKKKIKEAIQKRIMYEKKLQQSIADHQKIVKYLKEKIETGEIIYLSESDNDDINNNKILRMNAYKNDSMMKVNESLSMSGSAKLIDSVNNIKTISEDESGKINEAKINEKHISISKSKENKLSAKSNENEEQKLVIKNEDKFNQSQELKPITKPNENINDMKRQISPRNKKFINKKSISDLDIHDNLNLSIINISNHESNLIDSKNSHFSHNSSINLPLKNSNQEINSNKITVLSSEKGAKENDSFNETDQSHSGKNKDQSKEAQSSNFFDDDFITQSISSRNENSDKSNKSQEKETRIEQQSSQTQKIEIFNNENDNSDIKKTNDDSRKFQQEEEIKADFENNQNTIEFDLQISTSKEKETASNLSDFAFNSAIFDNSNKISDNEIKEEKTNEKVALTQNKNQTKSNNVLNLNDSDEIEIEIKVDDETKIINPIEIQNNDKEEKEKENLSNSKDIIELEIKFPSENDYQESQDEKPEKSTKSVSNNKYDINSQLGPKNEENLVKSENKSKIESDSNFSQSNSETNTSQKNKELNDKDKQEPINGTNSNETEIKIDFHHLELNQNQFNNDPLHKENQIEEENNSNRRKTADSDQIEEEKPAKIQNTDSKSEKIQFDSEFEEESKDDENDSKKDESRVKKSINSKDQFESNFEEEKNSSQNSNDSKSEKIQFDSEFEEESKDDENGSKKDESRVTKSIDINKKSIDKESKSQFESNFEEEKNSSQNSNDSKSDKNKEAEEMNRNDEKVSNKTKSEHENIESDFDEESIDIKIDTSTDDEQIQTKNESETKNKNDEKKQTFNNDSNENLKKPDSDDDQSVEINPDFDESESEKFLMKNEIDQAKDVATKISEKQTRNNNDKSQFEHNEEEENIINLSNNDIDNPNAFELDSQSEKDKKSNNKDEIIINLNDNELEKQEKNSLDSQIDNYNETKNENEIFINLSDDELKALIEEEEEDEDSLKLDLSSDDEEEQNKENEFEEIHLDSNEINVNLVKEEEDEDEKDSENRIIINLHGELNSDEEEEEGIVAINISDEGKNVIKRDKSSDPLLIKGISSDEDKSEDFRDVNDDENENLFNESHQDDENKETLDDKEVDIDDIVEKKTTLNDEEVDIDDIVEKKGSLNDEEVDIDDVVEKKGSLNDEEVDIDDIVEKKGSLNDEEVDIDDVVEKKGSLNDEEVDIDDVVEKKGSLNDDEVDIDDINDGNNHSS